MKNRKLIILPVVLLLLVLGACGNGAGDMEVMSEETSDISSEELLVHSLDYLLSGGDEGQEVRLQEVKMTEDVQPEAAGGKEVVIYYGNGASDELKEELLYMEQITADELVDALIRHNIIPLGTKVNSFEEQESEEGKMLFLDLSRTFQEYLRTMTGEGEQIIISSVVTTFLNAYDAEKIVITVDGDVLETDYAAYEEPLESQDIVE
ncbi:MAG: GerMN domain-containing protein [Muribaculaceae bacterium]|nr:GerMN domain-containing protein [Muribaculaceae bacterium]